MRRHVVVLGGTGHVGSYMCPRLALLPDTEVTCVSRGATSPYHADGGDWSAVKRVTLTRGTDEEGDREFAVAVAALKPTVVIDMICFTRRSCEILVDVLQGSADCEHLLHCGSIWVHGHSIDVPTLEDGGSPPMGEYGQQKDAIARYLLEEVSKYMAVTVVHPGHIVGKGWACLNPQGNFDPSVFAALRDGDQVVLPHLGMETVHHVHANDVATVFIKSMEHRDLAAGQAFHAVSPQAMTLRGYAERIARVLFKREAVLTFKPWSEFAEEVGPARAAMTWDHIAHSPNCSIAKLRDLLKFEPQDSVSAVSEAVEWMLEQGLDTIVFPGKQTSVPAASE